MNLLLLAPLNFRQYMSTDVPVSNKTTFAVSPVVLRSSLPTFVLLAFLSVLSKQLLSYLDQKAHDQKPWSPKEDSCSPHQQCGNHIIRMDPVLCVSIIKKDRIELCVPAFRTKRKK